ncbi:hypothetical protein [Streptomyces endophyticus]|uniref:Uncharacterized protein n=1 Tax=Streptomyces endophyticus TaxID=714166 RepID=A0ABU6FIN2_9ACTN|nr:hypothetical protein [Streptomyces endophyticus]MEB8343914.1 hypothetical protein [Streptomyces endophyticus]
MATRGDSYEAIMARLRQEMPSLAEQLDQEVRHGRMVSEKDLRQEGRYDERASRLAETELPPLGKSDVSVIPYTEDERFELVRDSLLTLAETMFATRSSALKVAMERAMEPEIRFGDPELEVLSRINLPEETERANIALRTVRGLLADDRDPHPEIS